MSKKSELEVATIECDEAHAVNIAERKGNKVALEFLCEDGAGQASLYNKLTTAAEGRSLKIVFVLGRKHGR